LLISSTLFAIMAALTKVATRRLPGAEVALMRFLAGVVLTGAAVAVGTARIRPRRWAWLGARGFFGGVSVVTYFAAIQTVPVGVATLLNQTQPVYTMLFSWLLLGERPRRTALPALALALGGVTVIVNAGLRGSAGAAPTVLGLSAAHGEILGVISAVTSGVAVTSIRAARRELADGTPSETAWSVFFSFSLVGALVTLPTVLPPFGRFVAPNATEWAIIGAIGLVSTAAQVIMSASLRSLTGVQSGIIAQLIVPITVLLGVAFLGEQLTNDFLLGATLTVSGVLLAILTASPRVRSRIGTGPVQ
jgi:drug/metabolite transporter (DMT)-like permease